MLSVSVPVPDWYFQRDYHALALLFRQLREELGWSQAQTGQRLGVTERTYGRWENGHECQLAALELLERIVADVRRERSKKRA